MRPARRWGLHHAQRTADEHEDGAQDERLPRDAAARRVDELREEREEEERDLGVECVHDDPARECASRRGLGRRTAAAAAPAPAEEEIKLPAVTVRRETPKVGRNDPCPCGSGKKFKNCHGA